MILISSKLHATLLLRLLLCVTLILVSMSCQDEVFTYGESYSTEDAYVRVINAVEGNPGAYIYYIDGKINGFTDSLSEYDTQKYNSPYLGNSLATSSPSQDRTLFHIDVASPNGITPYKWEGAQAGTGAGSSPYFPNKLHPSRVGPIVGDIDYYKWARIPKGSHKIVVRKGIFFQRTETFVNENGQTITQLVSGYEPGAAEADTTIQFGGGKVYTLVIAGFTDNEANLYVIEEPEGKSFDPRKGYLRLYNVTPEQPSNGISGNSRSIFQNLDVYMTVSNGPREPEGPEILVAQNLQAFDISGSGDRYFEYPLDSILQFADSDNLPGHNLDSYQGKTLRFRFYRAGENISTPTINTSLALVGPSDPDSPLGPDGESGAIPTDFAYDLDYESYSGLSGPEPSTIYDERLGGISQYGTQYSEDNKLRSVGDNGDGIGRFPLFTLDSGSDGYQHAITTVFLSGDYTSVPDPYLSGDDLGIIKVVTYNLEPKTTTSSARD